MRGFMLFLDNFAQVYYYYFMRLTTKGEYAVRAILDLAATSKGEPVQIKDIASREKISKSYIEQLFNKLRKSGIIKSIRGPQGGYVLARSAKKTTIGDVIRSVEGPVFLAICASGPCERSCVCRSSKLWKKLGIKIEAALDSVNIGELI